MKGALRLLHSFQQNEAATPSSDLTAADGAVWGTSFFGGVFKTIPSGTTTSYPYGLPTSPLLASGGAFYGSTQQGSPLCDGIDVYCGTIYTMTKDGQATRFYAFTATDQFASGSLAHVHKAIFGTSSGGGAPETIFKISPAGAATTLHSFAGGSDGDGANGLVESDGVLYGTVFRIKP